MYTACYLGAEKFGTLADIGLRKVTAREVTRGKSLVKKFLLKRSHNSNLFVVDIPSLKPAQF